MDYKIKLYSQLDEQLKKVWHNVEKNSHHTCFNSLAWIESYETSYQKDKSRSKLKIFIIFFKNEPICVLPFEVIKKFNTNVLQWACDLKSDFNAPVIKKNFNFQKKAFEEIWKKILKMIPEADLIYLKNQINFFEVLNNPFVNYLNNSKEGVVYQIQLPSKWSQYTDKILKRKFYMDLMRTKRLIKKHGKVEFVIAKSKKEKTIFLNKLIKQKSKKLEKAKKNSLNEEDLNFYKNLEMFENKQYITQVSGLKLNGEFIAMHWGVFNKQYYYYLLPSMKEDNVKQFSPGKLLLYLLIRWSISKKLKFFDFGLGEEIYKKKWSNKIVNTYNYIRIKKLKGVFFYLFLKCIQIIKYFKKNK